MKNKKGIAPIIATVLLIVIVIVAVALIIAFIIPFIQQQMGEAKLCFDARVDIKEACYYDENVLKVRVGRGAEEFDLTGMMMQISTATETKTSKVRDELKALEEKTLEINTMEFGFNSIEIISVAVAPIVKSGETEKTCEVTSTKTPTECLYNCLGKMCGESDGSEKECEGPCTGNLECAWINENEQWECRQSGQSS